MDPTGPNSMAGPRGSIMYNRIWTPGFIFYREYGFIGHFPWHLYDTSSARCWCPTRLCAWWSHGQAGDRASKWDDSSPMCNNNWVAAVSFAVSLPATCSSRWEPQTGARLWLHTADFITHPPDNSFLPTNEINSAKRPTPPAHGHLI